MTSSGMVFIPSFMNSGSTQIHDNVSVPFLVHNKDNIEVHGSSPTKIREDGEQITDSVASIR
jgi:hypothetical protein